MAPGDGERDGVRPFGPVARAAVAHVAAGDSGDRDDPSIVWTGFGRLGVVLLAGPLRRPASRRH